MFKYFNETFENENRNGSWRFHSAFYSQTLSLITIWHSASFIVSVIMLKKKRPIFYNLKWRSYGSIGTSKNVRHNNNIITGEIITILLFIVLTTCVFGLRSACISGVDGETAYTRNDFKALKGDVNLRKQVKLTKNMLGYCTPIVLESNGLLMFYNYYY